VSRPKTLQFAPVSFDVHFQEMFTTWHRSGAVVMITEEMRYPPALSSELSDTTYHPLWYSCTGIALDVSSDGVSTLLTLVLPCRLDTESMLEYIEKKSVNSLYLPFVALQQLCEVAVVCCG
jgi:non-ribosomal peptide synthetase component F